MYEGKTTGAPMLMIIYSKDARPKSYDAIKDLYRPGHADYTYLKKYGIRDHRGGGRSSARETAARVAAGAVARQLLARRGVSIVAYTIRAAGVACETVDLDVVEQNPMRACDPVAAEEMVRRVEQARADGDSLGGIIECRVTGVPVGLGDPVYDRLDADLAKAMLSINATKGVEFGAGFAAADMTGSEHNDAMDATGFVTNHAGGMLGGISTGADIVLRVVLKPTSSISKPQRSLDTNDQPTEVVTKGRHDPCLVPRGVPVVEAMAALVLEDHFKRHAALHA
jgi:chorismate synthase